MIVKSISKDEDEILLGILSLHNGGMPFDVDATYSVGGLYRSGRVPQPTARFDKSPQVAGVTKADVCALPIESRSIRSVCFDPPFMFNPHGRARDNKAKVRYSMFETWAELERTYKAALAEFARVLKPGGIVAFKCQDYTDSKTTMTHCFVHSWSIQAGLYPKDLFVRYREHGPAYNPALRQKHARKFHSYWFVLELPRSVR